MVSEEFGRLIQQIMKNYGYDIDDFVSAASILADEETDKGLILEIEQAMKKHGFIKTE